MTTNQIDELEKLWRTVEMTERVRDGLRDNILRRWAYSLSLFEPRDLSASERYVMELSERQLAEAKASYREAYLKLRASADCSTSGPAPPDPMSDYLPEDSSS